MRSRLPLYLIVFIGVITPLASTALFFFWQPAQQVNIGDVLPPQPLPETEWRYLSGDDFTSAHWRGDWVLLFAGGGDCDADCRRRLCQLRQLRLMLPGNYLRLRRAWLVTDNQPPPPALEQTTDCGELAAQASVPAASRVDTLADVEILTAAPATLPAAAAMPATRYLYLVDPAGIWAMRFPPDLTTYQIRNDINRLLRISKGRKQLQS